MWMSRGGISCKPSYNSCQNFKKSFISQLLFVKTVKGAINPCKNFPKGKFRKDLIIIACNPLCKFHTIPVRVLRESLSIFSQIVRNKIFEMHPFWDLFRRNFKKLRKNTSKDSLRVKRGSTVKRIAVTRYFLEFLAKLHFCHLFYSFEMQLENCNSSVIAWLVLSARVRNFAKPYCHVVIKL